VGELLVANCFFFFRGNLFVYSRAHMRSSSRSGKLPRTKLYVGELLVANCFFFLLFSVTLVFVFFSLVLDEIHVLQKARLRTGESPLLPPPPEGEQKDNPRMPNYKR
jgi:hypothetical protein